MAANPKARLIAQLARQRGLDPAAVLSIASVEGGFNGAIGDNGTSFGPFQLHVGGALPSGLSGNKAHQWANSRSGIEYALDRIKSVAGGLSGKDAITAIASKFERPADIPGEIAKASSRYGQFSGGKLPQGGGGLLPSAGTDVGGAISTLGGQSYNALLGAALLDMSQRTLQGEGPDPSSLVGLALARQSLGGAVDQYGSSPSADTPVLSGGPVRAGEPVAGKIIGTPGQGTHTLGNWESDNAVDVAVPVGTPIRAPFSGTIGSQFGSLGEGGRFAGLRLHVDGAGNEAYLAHLSKFAPGIKPGVKVKAGQVVGYSGEANGVAHLHFGLKSGDPLSLYS